MVVSLKQLYASWLASIAAKYSQQAGRRWRSIEDTGFDPALGARPLRRAIQKLVEDPLAEMVLRGKVHKGAEIRISKKGDELLLEERVPETSRRE